MSIGGPHEVLPPHDHQHMPASLTLGETIRRLRRHKKWSLGTLAQETGLSYSYLSRVENDSASPQADAVARLAEALDVAPT